MAADTWLAGVRARLSGFDSTEHVSSNHAHVIDGDEATCTSNLVAYHYLIDAGEKKMFTNGGYYTNRLRRGGLFV